jgi:protein-tyrosine phosphatase
VIDIDGTHNFRDVGGVPTTDGGTLRTGMLFRSAALDSLTPTGRQAMLDFGVRTVIDLRSAEEIDAVGRFEGEPDGVAWFHHGSPFGPSGSDEAASRELIEQLLVHDDPMAVLVPVLLRTGGESSFGPSLRLLADPERRPAVFHCTSGKDRTGLLAVLVHLICGVDLDVALVEFERSNALFEVIRANMVERHQVIGSLAPEIIDRVASADRAWVEAALDGVGGVDNLNGWLDSIGVDHEVRQGIRDGLVDR